MSSPRTVGLALRALARAGARVVAYEDPGGPATATAVAAEAAGLTAVRCRSTSTASTCDALAASGARAVVVTPGPPVSPPARPCPPSGGGALIDWAAPA